MARCVRYACKCVIMGVDSELGIGCLQSFSILVFETQSLVEHGTHHFNWTGFGELPSTEGTGALPYLIFMWVLGSAFSFS